MEQEDFYIGQTLANGALVIAARPDGKPSGNGRLASYIVLAIKNGGDAAHLYEPYVTWVANKENGTFSGNYHSDITEAAKDYAER